MEMNRSEPRWPFFFIIPLGIYTIWNCAIAFLLWKFAGINLFLPGGVPGGTVAGVIGYFLGKLVIEKPAGRPPRPVV
jgi:hypothetical protein